jgi:hypothetical protein
VKFAPTVIVGVAAVCAFAVPPKTIDFANATAAALTARRAARDQLTPFLERTRAPYATSLPGLQGS